MKYLYIPVLLFCLSLLNLNVAAQCSNGRYYSSIFNYTSNTVSYGRAPDYNGDTVDLKMDIYQPSGDVQATRPVIILAFGGSFTAGSRYSPDMITLCTEFAKRGYVTASIDYRIGKENGEDSSMYKAVIRGMQDMAAAIRFFYKDAYTTNDYRVDTSQIFMGGTSAGGFIGLNLGYFRYDIRSRPVPDYVIPILAELGDIEGNSGNPGYSHNVKGVINLCGAIMDTIWLQPNSIPLVAVHGTADNTVPFYYDSIAGVSDIKKRFFGSGDIDVRCNNIGLAHVVHPFYGEDHCPFVIPYPTYDLAGVVKYMDTTIQVVRDFLVQHVVCDETSTTDVPRIKAGLNVHLSPNPSDNDVFITSEANEDLVVQLYSLEGKMLLQKTMAPVSQQVISKGTFGAGMYLLKFLSTDGVEKRTEKLIFY